jgi:hypothetical protein
VGTRAAARVCSLLAVCFGACTTTAVNFAGGDAGASGLDAVVAPSDALSADAPAPDALPPIPDASLVGPREVAPDDQFMGLSVAGPSRYVQYKCCENGSCFVAVQGDDNTCRDASTWTLSATMDCESQGLTVGGIGLYVGC